MKNQIEPIIKVENVSKIFEIPHERRNSIKDYFLNPFHKINKDLYHALDQVSFEVNEGDFVGIIGKNGSGKSTLLKMIAQIYEPTSGKIIINGTMIPFLELGVGFNSELSGRENVFLNGIILGMSHKHMEEKFDEIVEFAGIREFIDLQVKNYSSGMIMRLAFSIAIQAKADIYLLDEILAVGDVGFREKSLAKMQELLTGGATVVFVSHSMADIEKYCDKVILLDYGVKVFEGKPKEAIKRYLQLVK